ncbi:hypothetical protein JM83_0303 [Gillisia sp. Hel_I_86]|uniref:DUF6095 family protein n=1 Tax=Gillisia sp. Hel_I_86 TaxID=1249981 RepID=UPI00119BFEA0|nr:DUF6095 family protein [Gillisia sp. Hel_I_86]TVZ25397.1 hypothetical protein JM83_0303 [Gillisia sp. Hel_I_86]
MKHTNRELLGKGLKYLAGALPLTLLGPVVLYSAFHNKEHPYYIFVLIFGLLALVGAIILMFSGIKTIMKALFD